MPHSLGGVDPLNAHDARLVATVGRRRVHEPGVGEHDVPWPSGQLSNPHGDSLDLVVALHESRDAIGGVPARRQRA